MKITDIQVTPSLGAENRNWVLMRILTDEGIVGLGEWFAGSPVGQFKQALVGEDPRNINKLHSCWNNLLTITKFTKQIQTLIWD